MLLENTNLFNENVTDLPLKGHTQIHNQQLYNYYVRRDQNSSSSVSLKNALNILTEGERKI